MSEYHLYSEKRSRMIAAKPTQPGQRSMTATVSGVIRRTVKLVLTLASKKRFKLNAQFEIKKCARDTQREK